MFQFLFKYPAPTFSKGQFVLLGPWPKWALFLAILAAAAGLGWLIRSRLPRAAPRLRSWRAGIIWLLQAALAALVLILLWQPAITVAQLKPQQNIIALLVDDSHSMSIADADGGNTTRLAQGVNLLQGGVLADLQKKFQTRLYSLDSHLTRVSSLKGLQPAAPATHIGESLKQFVAETSDLPVGAIVLLTDGDDNSGGIDLDTIAALRNRRIPVHTVGLGAEEMRHDVEIDDAAVAPRAMADSRLTATVTLHQQGYAGAEIDACGSRRGEAAQLARNHIWRQREKPIGDTSLQRRRCRSQGAAVFDRPDARRGKSAEQRRHAAGECDVR